MQNLKPKKLEISNGMKHETNESLAPHLKIGQKGEDIAVKHLVKHNYRILDRNYRKKWGEIDIVAKKDGTLHFIEVKTVSHETDYNNYLPEENISFFKKQRFSRIIQTYLIEKHVSCETEFQVDALAIFFNPDTQETKIREIENIIL